jgi:hypothetical protein
MIKHLYSSTQIPKNNDEITLHSCSYQNIYFITDILPDTLEKLECSPDKLYFNSEYPYYYTNYKHLQVLPKLPIMLKHLCVKYNMLKYLPELPETLITLDCTSNHLEELPKLPSNLILLNCYGNKLKNLPELPNSLINLCVRQNSLFSLPKLPPNLVTLDCRSNYLKELPQIPSTLIELECSGNKLDILPDMNDIIKIYYFSYSDQSYKNSIYYNYLLKNYKKKNWIEYIKSLLFSRKQSLNENSSISNISFTLTGKFINKVNEKLRKFKYLFYCIVFKKKFILWYEKIKKR